MKPADYAAMVAVLAKPGEDILDTLSPERVHLLHMAVGVAGEAGELLDAIKKHCFYNKPLDLNNVVEELGDLEFYMEGLRQGLSLLRQEILEYNMVKLSERYNGLRYSDQAAWERKDKTKQGETK